MGDIRAIGTADVTGGKPNAVWLQSISRVNAINPLIAFYDIHGRMREVPFFCSVPDTARDFVFYYVCMFLCFSCSVRVQRERDIQAGGLHRHLREDIPAHQRREREHYEGNDLCLTYIPLTLYPKRRRTRRLLYGILLYFQILRYRKLYPMSKYQKASKWSSMSSISDNHLLAYQQYLI
jgi:hypothetical protein